MEKVKLKEIATITAGQAAPKDFSNIGTTFIRAGHLEDLILGIDINSLPKVTDEIAKKNSLKILPKGAILFAKSGMSAKKNRIYISKEDTYFVSHLAAILPSKKYNTNFLARFLYWYNPTNLILDDSYPSIRLEDINNLEIPLPPLPTQQKIASILDKADELCQYNKQLIEKYEALTQSLFLDMFGDPVRNSMDFPLQLLKEFGTSRLGKMLDGKKIIGNNLKPYLRNSNVQWFRFQLDDLLKMDFDEKDKVEFSLKFGDILMCEGGEIGRCAIWKDEIEDCYFQKAIHRIRLNDKYMQPEYFVYMFKNLSDNGGLDEFKSAATISHLTGEKLKKMRIPIPPIELQNQFAERVQLIESQKQQAQEALAKSEQLFQGLLQQAFKGELN